MQPPIRRWALRLTVALVSLAASLSLIEAIFRVADHDFDQKRETLSRVPIFYRVPTVPVGEAFHRRPGPDRWQGKVITPMLLQAGFPARFTPDEAPLSIAYDADGFRNPEDLTDWDVVLVGDSFTELGNLPDRELVSSRIGEALGIRVKNLGVSYTGTRTHVAYLQEFGGAPSARHAVLAFFEGNDIDDLVREEMWLRTIRKRREQRPEPQPRATREDPTPAPQTSFLRALVGWVAGERDERARKSKSPNAVFVDGDLEMPMSLGSGPPSRRYLGTRREEFLDRALDDFARTSRNLGMKPWLLYMPCKRRALEEGLRVLDPAAKKVWAPRGIRAFIRSLARSHDIEFVDPTGALKAQTATGRVTYNAIDIHLNSLGAEVVADVMVAALAGWDERERR